MPIFSLTFVKFNSLTFQIFYNFIMKFCRYIIVIFSSVEDDSKFLLILFFAFFSKLKVVHVYLPEIVLLRYWIVLDVVYGHARFYIFCINIRHCYCSRVYKIIGHVDSKKALHLMTFFFILFYFFRE